MEEITGKIEKIEMREGNTNNKPWTKWTFTINGLYYATFDKDIGEAFSVNDTVLMKGEMKGKYWGMKTMEVVSPQHGEVKEEPKSVTPKEFHLTIEQCRSNALESAIKVTKKLNTDDYVSDLMENAKQFEDYILNG